ncbi:MAG: membrane dipeptidase, partial [Planctomycetota bacterium]|nr:membrane dipeptidase [Planctomycetota bacterium]
LHRLERSVPRPPLSKLVDHIEHIIELAGIDAVGVGTDYDLGAMPDEVEDAGNLSCLTRALLERGYSDDEIKKFWGGNFMRIFA